MEGSAVCSLCGSRLPYTAAPTPPVAPTVTAPTTPVTPQAPAAPQANHTTLTSAGNRENICLNLFQGQCWEDYWYEAVEVAGCKDNKAGIILTNTRGCSGALKNELYMNLLDYINFKAGDGVDYYVLDLATQVVGTYTGEIESVIDIISDVYRCEKIDYIMIVGDFTTVPHIVWENKSRDSDKYVFSDLPYITIDTDSPFNDILYDFTDRIKVGRIPTSAAVGFKDAFTYFKNTKNSRLNVNDLRAFFLSAESWIRTSQNIGRPVSADINVSPTNGSFEYRGNLDPYNVLMFNLHGSSGTHLWYGEDNDEDFGPAFSAPKLPKNRNYILCSEACYGARPFNDGKNAESIVSTALRSGCCAFVGSTQIAYGMGEGPISCADVIISYFIKDMMDGYSAGESFNDALSHLEEGRWDDCTLKTLMEFALYGDPSYAPIGADKKSNTKVKKKAFSKNNLSYRVVEGEEQKAVSVKAAFVEDTAHCAVKVKAFVEEAHPDMKGIKPRFFMDECTGDYQAIYNKTTKNKDVSKIVKVFFDNDGTVKNQYVSK